MAAHSQDVQKGSAALMSLLVTLGFIQTPILEEATRISNKPPSLPLPKHSMMVQLSLPLAK